MHGLNLYDYSARYYDGTIPRFTMVDPHAENYYSWSPYVYCFNNPIKFVDKDGKDPGDPFKTPNDAAKDFALYYSGASIIRNKEFGSTIYVINDGSDTPSYAYSIANIGSAKTVTASDAPDGETEVAIAHTHGNYDSLALDPHEINNNFSPDDKELSDNIKLDNYVATSSGELKKYDHNTKEVSNIKIDNLPSDPRDPKKINNIKPVDTNPVYNEPNKAKKDSN